MRAVLLRVIVTVTAYEGTVSHIGHGTGGILGVPNHEEILPMEWVIDCSSFVGPPTLEKEHHTVSPHAHISSDIPP